MKKGIKETTDSKGRKQYQGFYKILWLWIPVTKKSLYKEDIKEKFKRILT